MDPWKKCWNCFEKIPITALECPACKKKVGEPNAHGIGKRPFDWLGYSQAAAGIMALAYFIYWLAHNYKK